MARAAHPEAMAPSKPGRTRTAPPQMPPKFPMQGRYRAYTIFDATGLVYLLMGFGVLHAVRALGGTPVLVPVEELFRFLREAGWEAEPFAFVHPWIDRDVLVVAMGEFGRTPRINRNAGRDHWAPVMSVVFSGGALRMGQIIGSSTALGDAPKEYPFRPDHVLSMVYRHLGIDPSITFPDFSGRPRYLLEHHDWIHPLI